MTAFFKLSVFYCLIVFFFPLSPAFSADPPREKESPLYLEVRLQFLRDAFHHLPTGEEPIRYLEKERILYGQGAYEKAVAAYRLVGDDRSSSPLPEPFLIEARYLAANSYLRMGEYARAESLFLRIPDSSGYYLYARYGAALTALYLYQGDRAVDHLTKVAEEGGRSGEKSLRALAEKARLTLGFFFLEQGRVPEAVSAFSGIPAESPFHPQALFGIGWTYARMGEWTRALIFWQDLPAKYPEHSSTQEVLLAIGQSYSRLSAYVKAAEAYGEALRIFGVLRDELTRRSVSLKGLSEPSDPSAIERIEAIAEFSGVDLGDRLIRYRGVAGMESYVADLLRGMDEARQREGTKESAEDRFRRERYAEFRGLAGEVRREIWGDLFQKTSAGLAKREESLLEESAVATVEIARNLRLAKGGGESGR
ncbi:MAG: tetratricopeptide repeat protein [Nitrospirae bacterium]|nr:tetratricopeptide repeat protein [Nitrospirota bacterium]